MIQLGQTVGNYRVTALLGEGGMGAVFLAQHPVIGRKVALKVVHPQHARNLEVVGRFVNEATAISRIGHEHIVEVMDLGRTAEGDFYIVMEYLDGRPLAQLLAQEAPLRPERAIAIAVQIADALGASHEAGIVHRDVKPENVFLVRRGHDADFVKVLDFGLAKLLDGAHAAGRDTSAGTVMGTPHYMAPEQCRAEGEIDHRADVYALGVVLFEMLTGTLPFAGEVYSDILVKQVTMRPPAARSIVPDLPEELDSILQRALAKHPDDRFPTMAALRDALLAPPTAASATPRFRTHEATPTPVINGALEPYDPSLDRVPRRYNGRTLAIVGAALGGMALAAYVTRSDANQAKAQAAEPPVEAEPPRTVLVRFGSDPDGATVTSSDGKPLGATPLSIQIPRSAAPATYVFRKPGFAPRSVSFVPNVPSSTFALLRADEPPATTAAVTDAPPMPAPHADERSRRRHEPSPTAAQISPPAEAPPSPLDDDGILEPSFVK
jgi:serine/threonine-protein kinase